MCMEVKYKPNMRVNMKRQLTFAFEELISYEIKCSSSLPLFLVRQCLSCLNGRAATGTAAFRHVSLMPLPGVVYTDRRTVTFNPVSCRPVRRPPAGDRHRRLGLSAASYRGGDRVSAVTAPLGPVLLQRRGSAGGAPPPPTGPAITCPARRAGKPTTRLAPHVLRAANNADMQPSVLWCCCLLLAGVLGERRVTGVTWVISGGRR